MSFEVLRLRADAPEVQPLLLRHLDLMRAQTPPESCHALDASGLVSDDIAFFALRENGVVLGIGAVKTCEGYGEIKSMHTAAESRGRGVATALLRALMKEAQAAGLREVRLETGSGPEHKPARELYAAAGFGVCPPFGEYREDPLSTFMCRVFRERQPGR
jgi:putative acetyltransferase